MSEIQPMGFRNAYVLEEIDLEDTRIVGIFEAEGLAEMARREVEASQSDYARDAGIFYRITVFEIGKTYAYH
jgi:hypothetical protein